MSDEELVKRLRRHRYNTWNDDLGPEQDKALAADRIEELGKACAEWADVSQTNYQRAKAGEAKLEKVLNHIRRMQAYVLEYLVPGPYIQKHGKGETFHEPHPHQDEAYAYFMRQQMREAVLNDLIHMLDGPEERAALADIEVRND